MKFHHTCLNCDAKFESRKSTSKFCCRSCHGKHRAKTGTIKGFATKTVDQIWAESLTSDELESRRRQRSMKLSKSSSRSWEDRFDDEMLECLKDKARRTWSEKFGDEEALKMKSQASSALSGKSWNEVLGLDKAENARAKLRARENPFSGKHHTDASKSQISKAHKARIARMTPSERERFCNGGNAYSGWYKGRFFRSSLEYFFMKHLEKSGTNLSGVLYEEFVIPYVKPEGTQASYVPDFFISETRLLCELKMSYALTDETVRRKHEAAKEFSRLNDMTFMVVTEKDIEYVWKDAVEMMTNDHDVRLSRKRNTNDACQ